MNCVVFSFVLRSVGLACVYSLATVRASCVDPSLGMACWCALAAKMGRCLFGPPKLEMQLTSSSTKPKVYS